MNGSLAQKVALVAHGNAFLSQGGSPPQLAETNSTFRHVGALRFVITECQLSDANTSSFRSDSQALEIASTADWFQHLKECGVVRLWLGRFQRHGAIEGFLDEEIYAERLDAAWRWRGAWESSSADVLGVKGVKGHKASTARRQRIWRVTYRGTAADGTRPDLPELASARQELAHALRGALQFASEARLRIWPELLEAGYAQLQSSTPQLRCNPDMLPASGYSLETRQLLAAGDAAWVFDGMGSWNDLVFEGVLKEQYNRITLALYSAVVSGIVAATNAFDSHLRDRK